MGHKRLAIEAGEDSVRNPIEYILESIKTIYSITHKNGAIRRVNVNIAATTVENYRKLKEAGIGTYILFQETYNKKDYEALHPTGPKHDYAYHTEAMDRAMAGGIDDVGIGVLYGLHNYRYDLPDSSCIRNIWKPSLAWALIPSVCHVSDRPTTFLSMHSPMLYRMIFSRKSSLSYASPFRIRVLSCLRGNRLKRERLSST